MANVGVSSLFGHRIVAPDEIPDLKFDLVVIALSAGTRERMDAILQIHAQLLDMGVPDSKILVLPVTDTSTVEPFPPGHIKFPRFRFVEDFAELVRTFGIEGAIAECGVGHGTFAGILSRCFPDKKLYLFDTYEGYRLDDDATPGETEIFTSYAKRMMESKDMLRELVRLKCVNRKNVVIVKGHVPGSLSDMTETRFAFVSLDMDLYAPTVASLRFFRDKMAKGGVVLVHDYFVRDVRAQGVMKAVKEFAVECDCDMVPIGDGMSVALSFA
jgi:hypothetical protein